MSKNTGMWTYTCVLHRQCIINVFSFSNEWVKYVKYFTVVQICFSFPCLGHSSGKINTWNLVTHLSLQYTRCHKMLNMNLNQIIHFNKLHESKLCPCNGFHYLKDTLFAWFIPSPASPNILSLSRKTFCLSPSTSLFINFHEF